MKVNGYINVVILFVVPMVFICLPNLEKLIIMSNSSQIAVEEGDFSGISKRFPIGPLQFV